MKKEFIIERSGKQFVLYAGLLDKAHESGLKTINTTLLQVPSDDNGQVAICQAFVETTAGTFSGLGDASPRNVPGPMRECLVRFAETRAKARALRDAVNVGVVALEELGLEDETADAANGNGRMQADLPFAREPAPAAAPAKSEPTPFRREPLGGLQGPSATPAQVKAIYAIARNEHQLTLGQVDERSQELYGATPAELSKRQASEFIDRLRSAGIAS
jgi:hypothetical protein